MKRLMQRACGVVIMVLLVGQVLVPAAPVQAATTYTITYTGDEFGTNASRCSLREAIFAANKDTAFDGCPKGSGADTIILKGLDYQLTLNSGANDYSKGDLDIYSSMTISGAGPTATRIMGVGLSDRIFQIYKDPAYAAPVVNISNLTINGGVVTALNDGGGGIKLQAGSLNLSWVLLSSNSAPSGGGVMVYRDAAEFRAKSVVLRSNQATGDTGKGGGIYNEATMILEHSLLVGNSAPDSGGGIDNRPFNADDYAQVTNTTIAMNTSDGGAGIANSSLGELRLYNNTIARNTGSGLWVNDNAVVKMRQTILALNSTPNCRKSSKSSPVTLVSEGYNLIMDDHIEGTEQCVFTYPDPQYIGTDMEGAGISPLLSLSLQPPPSAKLFMQWFEFTSNASPAIDAIDPLNTACPLRDQLYYPRPANGLCDIGAIEYGAKDALISLNIPMLRR